MSTFLTADFGSESEPEDADFKPSSPKVKRKRNTEKVAKKLKSGSESSASDSESSGSDSEAEEAQADRDDSNQRKREEEDEERRRRAEDALKALREEVKEDSFKKAEVSKGVVMVEILKARSFAGETIYETVSLPADNPEAIAYIAKQSQAAGVNATDTEGASSSLMTADIASPSTGVEAPEGKPKPRGPIRKKPRQSLEQMASALDKGKKMTTLEKSQLDWRSHTSSSTTLKDELEANRRSGGQLANKEFLDRVGERRADAIGKGGGGRGR